MVARVGPLVGAQGGVRGVLAPDGVQGGLVRVEGVVGLVDLDAGDLDEPPRVQWRLGSLVSGLVNAVI